MADFKEKVAVITGASSGIGQRTAIELAKRGCFLSICGRNKDNLDKTKEKSVTAGLSENQILCVLADVTEDNLLEKLVKDTIAKFGKIDILVNSAGFTIAQCNIEAPIKNYDSIMNTNLRSTILLSKLCLEHLKKTKGTIVNVSSIAGSQAMNFFLYYAVSKAGIEHFTRLLALELASDGVRVNAVCPTVVNTPFLTRHFSLDMAKFNEFQSQCHPMGRIAEVEEVVNAIMFLASSNASFITGHCLPIDGAASLATAWPRNVKPEPME